MAKEETKELLLVRETPDFYYEALIGDVFSNGKKILYGHKNTLIANLKPFFPDIKRRLRKAKGRRDPFFEDLVKLAREVKETVGKVSQLVLSPEELKIVFEVGESEYYLVIEPLSIPHTDLISVSVYLWKDNDVLAEIVDDYATLYEDESKMDKKVYKVLLLAEEFAEKYMGYNSNPTETSTQRRVEAPVIEFWV